MKPLLKILSLVIAVGVIAVIVVFTNQQSQIDYINNQLEFADFFQPKTS